MADNEQQPPISPMPGIGAAPEDGAFPENTPGDSSLGQQVSAVAESSGKKTALLVVGGLIVMYMLYGMMFGEKELTLEELAKIEEEKKGAVSQDTGLQLPADIGGPSELPPEPMQVPIPPIPPMPTPPPVVAAPTAAPAVPGIAQPALPPMPGLPGGGLQRPLPPGSGGQMGGGSTYNFSEAEKASVRANSILQGGSGRFVDTEQSQGISSSSGAAGSTGSSSSGTQTDQRSSVNEVGDPRLTIAQGKILSAVLETAINTDLPGALRAVVSRDAYAEQGKNILIPRGSRLIGSYNTDVKRGQARIYIVWNRLIMPSGHDLSLGSPSTDLLGRSGIEGHVDNKYFELFSNSLLLSSLSVGFAAAVDEVTDSQGISQGETGSGSATTSGSVIDIATLDAVNDFSDQVQGVVQELVEVAPTITVDQGTRVKIFVNRDLFFPEDLAFTLDAPETPEANPDPEVTPQ